MNKTCERDSKIDALRAFAMLWVILVHCLYWLNIFSYSTVKSFVLFEMPLFFFLTGASNYKSKGGYFRFELKRILGIYIPYLCYAIICLSILFICNGTISIATVLRWLIPLNVQVSAFPFSTYALWFVTCYILIIFSFPLYKFIYNKINDIYCRFVPIIVLIIFFICVFFIPMPSFVDYWIKTFLFYSIWTYFGMFYWVKFDKKRTNIVLACLIFVFAVVLALLGIFKINLNMQANKFPPNGIFLCFSGCTMCIIYFVSKYIDITYNLIKKKKILYFIVKPYAFYSCSVFLYQTFIFYVINFFITHLSIGTTIAKISVLYFIFALLVAIILCSLIGRVFSFVERFSKRITKNEHI